MRVYLSQGSNYTAFLISLGEVLEGIKELQTNNASSSGYLKMQGVCTISENSNYIINEAKILVDDYGCMVLLCK